MVLLRVEVDFIGLVRGCPSRSPALAVERRTGRDDHVAAGRKQIQGRNRVRLPGQGAGADRERVVIRVERVGIGRPRDLIAGNDRNFVDGGPAVIGTRWPYRADGILSDEKSLTLAASFAEPTPSIHKPASQHRHASRHSDCVCVAWAF